MTPSPTSTPTCLRSSPTSSGHRPSPALALHGLDRNEVGELVGATDEQAAAIVLDTGGNPLLVTHMTSNVERGSLPVWLVRRDALLDDEARAVLDLAATFGSEFDADLLAAAHGAPLLDVLESLEAAEAAGLIVPHRGRAAQFGFVHALFRAHRYDALPLRRRLELHARVATALGTRAGDDRVLSEHARHACLALPLGDAGDGRPTGARCGPARRAAPTPTTKRSSTTGVASMPPASSIRRTRRWRST